ncbi:MAG: hypothetical protein K6E45_01190 [Bacteroidaceae bacterium]|nr:hypothetical protein [Bacteroidaceae bacterium]
MPRFTVTGTLLPKLVLVLMLVVSMASCSTTRVQSSAERDSIVVIHDTVFSARLQYNSTFNDRYHSVIAIDSIVYVRDSVVLYRYKLKHDSVFIHKTDTLWMQRTKTKTKEVERRRTWFDYTAYAALAILALMGVKRLAVSGKWLNSKR